jgi:hypothetical protein
VEEGLAFNGTIPRSGPCRSRIFGARKETWFELRSQSYQK